MKPIWCAAAVMVIGACQSVPERQRAVYLPGQLYKSRPPAAVMVIEQEPELPTASGRPWCEDVPRPDCISQADIAGYIQRLRCWGYRGYARIAALNEWAGRTLPAHWDKDRPCGTRPD